MEKENFYFGKPVFINSNESLNMELDEERSSQNYFWDIPEESDNVDSLDDFIRENGLVLEIKNDKLEHITQFRIDEEDYFMDHFFDLNTTFQLDESVACIITHVSNLERFPTAGRSNISRLPCIFAWYDVNIIFESEYSTIVQNYFRQNFKNLQKNAKIFFSISATCEKMKSMKSIQKEMGTGRLMFHYVGYGFPDIDEKGIWCGEKRLNEFGQFSFRDLFSCIGNPSLYIFDCNNAATAIEQFKLIDEDSQQKSDWLCICSSGIDQELPSDPRLPKDFFTSILFTPLKTAVICHLLRYYHLNNTTSNFIIDPPFQHLWSEKSQESEKLNLFLTAIEDSIAVDCLPNEKYQMLFQKDHFITSVFRAFLLSQFLLKYFRVTPHSYPEIPDTSSHHLWRRWIVVLDSYISNNNQIPRFSYVDEFFSLASESFKIILENNQIQYIHPYYPTLLYYMMSNNSTDDYPYFLLYKYCINGKSNPQIISPNLIFNNLLMKIITKDPRAQHFYQFCFLIVYLIRHNPSLISEFKSEINVSDFSNYIFKHDISIEVRIICAIIIACFVVCSEQFQQICSSQDYLDKIQNELKENENFTFVSWLLLIIKRAFYLYTPEISFFTSNGLHIQCSLLLNSSSQAIRAGAISVLTCFMRPFNSKINTQLFFLSLKSYSDPSFLVRFNFILMIKKFIISYDCFDIESIKKFSDDTFIEFIDNTYKKEELKFKNIDQLIKDDDCSKIALSLSLYLLNYYLNDPHPRIQDVTNKILQYIEQNQQDFDCEFNNEQSDEFYSKENLLFSNLDQNESFFSITLHNYITNSQNIEESIEECPKLCEKEYDNLTEQKIEKIHIIQENYGIAFNTSTLIFCIRSNGNITHFDFSENGINDFQPIKFNGNNCILILAKNTINVWNPGKKVLDITFNIPIFKSHSFLIYFDNQNVFTISEDGGLTKICLLSQQIIFQKKISLEQKIISVEHFKDYIILGLNNGNLCLLNIDNHETKTLSHSIKIHKMIYKDDILYILNENQQIEICDFEQFTQIENILNVTYFQVMHDHNILCCRQNECPIICNKFGNILKTINIPIDDYSCNISQDGSLFAFGTSSGILNVIQNKNFN